MNGDIVQWIFLDYKNEEIGRENFIVSQNKNGWKLEPIKKYTATRYLARIENYEVIGNIYDNKNLLEE